jgi:hypothetical protein
MENLIIESLRELQKIGTEKAKSYNQQESKLIFPKYCCGKHAGEKRVSEQEARLLFIRELEKQSNFYYSIETPSSKLYKFSDKNDKKFEPKIIPVGQESGQSASFDLTIYNNKSERMHFVEFKNGNVDTVKKDFLKLLCDEKDKENYFVNILERDNLNKRNTLDSIITKYQVAVDYIKDEIDKSEHTNSTLKIFLFNINDGCCYQFEDIDLKTNTEMKTNRTFLI